MNFLSKILLLTLAVLVCATGPAWAAKNCKAKEEVLERKIALARERGNQHRVAGLEQALANVRRYCRDGSMRGKAGMNLADKREEVQERRQELEEARLKGDPEKIAKRERKLREAEREMAAAEQELNALDR
ncbi:DUF1090 domain-containing protein [Desulfovibrio sp. OttesenSCG-928-O18]|nr:DUF1090 domain-containing protein [Desulfovibrio sp. OttesenSCG-928-O18]